MTPPTVELALPLAGPCLVQNSPADRVPSHGTSRFATAYAIDLVPVDAHGRSARVRVATLLRPEPPERFVGFGAPVLAPVSGTAVAVRGEEPDHAAYRGAPSIGYALTRARRVAAGWRALAGNHVVIEVGPGVYVALCHLRRGSPRVAAGQRVAVGEVVGACGNSGNSTEPHVHLQAMDDPDVPRATALPITFPGGLPRNGEIVAP